MIALLWLHGIEAKNDRVKHIKYYFEVEGGVLIDRPKKTWDEDQRRPRNLLKDLTKLHITKQLGELP